jgi:hypothetical protein
LFTLRTISVELDDVSYFASIIIRNSHPNYAECIDAIDAFEKEIKEKLSEA